MAAQRKTSLKILDDMTSIGWVIAVAGILLGVLLLVAGGPSFNALLLSLGYISLGLGLTFVPTTFIVTAIYHLARANVAAVLKPNQPVD